MCSEMNLIKIINTYKKKISECIKILSAKESANGDWYLIKPLEIKVVCFISQSLIKAFFSPIQTISVRCEEPEVSIPSKIK